MSMTMGGSPSRTTRAGMGDVRGAGASLMRARIRTAT